MHATNVRSMRKISVARGLSLPLEDEFALMPVALGLGLLYSYDTYLYYYKAFLILYLPTIKCGSSQIHKGKPLSSSISFKRDNEKRSVFFPRALKNRVQKFNDTLKLLFN
uniref:Uncharacterized protein n=1 Tax=Glossina brevipalpis TaxID=37001 RepID=A0A1A9X4C8_9MUSC